MINTETRLGRMLEAGRLTATVTSKVTGQHLTVTIKSLAKPDGARGWQAVPFAEGTLIVVDEGDGGWGAERIGRIRGGDFIVETRSASLAYAARAVLRAAHTGDLDQEKCSIVESNRCGHCGRDLTDPVSVERGIGPECNRKATKSKSARAKALAEIAA